MKNNIKVDPDTYSRIEEMISQNLNPNQICTSLEKDKNLSYTYTTLKGIIHKNFHKEWDKKSKKWVDCEPGDFHPSNTINEQLSLDGVVDIPQTDIDNKKKVRATPKVPSPKTPSTTKSSLETPLIDDKQENMSTILQKMYKLQKDIEDIKKMLLQIQRDNPKNKLHELSDDFIKIYASSKSKTSISINEELKEKVKKFIEESYNIKDNDSLVFNTALLLALCNGR